MCSFFPLPFGVSLPDLASSFPLYSFSEVLTLLLALLFLSNGEEERALTIFFFSSSFSLLIHELLSLLLWGSNYVHFLPVRYLCTLGVNKLAASLD